MNIRVMSMLLLLASGFCDSSGFAQSGLLMGGAAKLEPITLPSGLPLAAKACELRIPGTTGDTQKAAFTIT